MKFDCWATRVIDVWWLFWLISDYSQPISDLPIPRQTPDGLGRETISKDKAIKL